MTSPLRRVASSVRRSRGALGLAPLLLASFALALAAGCECSAPAGTPCGTAEDCASGEMCSDGVCVESIDGGPTGSPDASDRDTGPVTPRPDSGGPCGADNVECGRVCCAIGEMCEAGECVVACADEARRCGSLCCDEGEACLGQSCATLGRTCELTEECEIDEICLPELGRCAPRDSVEVCEFIPPRGEFTPQVGCRWTPPAGVFASHDDVVMTPVVINVSDDNGDGRTDDLDTPDIIFASSDHQRDGCCSFRGVIRVVSGACAEDGTMTTLATIETQFVDVSGGVAVGNLHPDSMADERAPEIVAYIGGGNSRVGNTTNERVERNGVVAFRRTSDDGTQWEELWRNDEPIADGFWRRYSNAAAQPSIADLTGDGSPEVVIGNVVLNGMTGEVVWDGLNSAPVGTAPNGIGNNAFLGPTSTVADLDLDGAPEVIAGNTVYRGSDGSVIWSFEYTSDNSICQGGRPCDGYNAVGNFDDDPEGEVVAIRRGQVYVFNHDGTVLHQVDIPWDDCGSTTDPPSRRNESGPPTVADFDGDGRAEIGTASADFYVVVDFDCVGDPLPDGCATTNILWAVPNNDCSSRATGSSVFDFEGDGKAEVVYADEVSFRIFDGTTGAILFDDPTHRSNTRMEMPIVVDVDNDGQAEVIVPEPNGNADLGGIEVWEDAENNWVRTRRIWNQHTYHVTNITDDGQIPRVEPPNWSNSRLNNFRQNVQPGGLFDATDLTVTDISFRACENGAGARIAVTVKNQGAVSAAPGVPVHAVATLDTGAVVDLGVERTVTSLLPGREETLTFLLPIADVPTGVSEFNVEATVDSDGMGGSRYNECDEDNNALSTETAILWCNIG